MPEITRQQVLAAPISTEFGWLERKKYRPCPNHKHRPPKLMVHPFPAEGCPECGHISLPDEGTDEHLGLMGEAIHLQPSGNA